MIWLRRIAIGVVALLIVGIGTLWAFQRSLIYYPDPAVIAPTMEGVTAQRIRTTDGETLVAWYLPPRAGQPIFLFFDGNGGRPHIQDGRWERIAEHGAGFLAVYYRGYSGSTGSPSERGLHEDARAGYDWLVAKGYRAQDIVIHGFSLGSGVAVKLATERKARALVLEAPFTGAVDVAAHVFSGAPVGLLMQDQFRSRDWIGDVHTPVLIAHGDRDSVVPFAQGERLYELANTPKVFVHMPGSDHATLVRDGLYPHVWKFLDAHAPASISP